MNTNIYFTWICNPGSKRL